MAVFVMRHRGQDGGGKRELQHIVNVIALNMVCTSCIISPIHLMVICFPFFFFLFVTFSLQRSMPISLHFAGFWTII